MIHKRLNSCLQLQNSLLTPGASNVFIQLCLVFVRHGPSTGFLYATRGGLECDCEERVAHLVLVGMMIYVAVVKTNRRSQVPFGDDYHPTVVYFTEVFSMFTGVQWGLGRRTICEEIFVDNESLIIYVS